MEALVPTVLSQFSAQPLRKGSQAQQHRPGWGHLHGEKGKFKICPVIKVFPDEQSQMMAGEQVK